MGPVIGRSQAQKQWAALPDHLKKREAAPMGAQQFGDPQRYVMAGVAPGWYTPALDNQKQLERLQAVERAKFGPKTTPEASFTFGSPVNVADLYPSGLANVLASQQAGQRYTPQIQNIRNQFLSSIV